MRVVTLSGEQALGLACKLVEQYKDDLNEHELKAFRGMSERARPLSEKQRVWVVEVAQRVGVDPNRNLFSMLSTKERAAERAAVRTLLPWERGEQTLPKKPPGRT